MKRIAIIHKLIKMMDPTYLALPDTMELRYVGERFDGGKLPVDVLGDLLAYKEAIVAIAKEIWRAENPTRKRLPNGFSKDIGLNLLTIKEGSAIPQLKFVDYTRQPDLIGHDRFDFNRAHNELMTIFKGHPTTLQKNYEILRQLNRIGASLKEGERLEFSNNANDNGSVIYLDKSRRREILKNLTGKYQSEIEESGLLRGVYQSDNSYYILVETLAYGEIKIHLPKDEINNEFGNRIGSLIQFKIMAEFDLNDRLAAVISVDSISITGGSSVQKREERSVKLHSAIQDYSRLESGWLSSGGGEAPSAQSIASAGFLLSSVPEFNDIASVFPRPEGGIVFECRTEALSIRLDIMNDGQIEIFAYKLSNDEDLLENIYDNSVKAIPAIKSLLLF